MYFDFLDIILVLEIVQCSIFFFFLLQKTHRKRANLFLAIFFVSQMFVCIHIFSFHHHTQIASAYPHLFFIGTPFYFLIGPSLLLYTKSAAFPRHRFEASSVIHLVLFIVAVLFFAVRFHFHSPDTKRLFIQNDLIRNFPYLITFNSILFIQLTVYIALSIRVIRKYRELMKQEYSSLDGLNLSWLKLFLYGYLLAGLTSVLYTLYYLFYADTSFSFQVANNLVFFIFFNIIFYKGLVQPELFLGIEEKPKYLTSRLNKNDGDKYASMLSAFMEKEKPYLNPTITLRDLSKHLSIAPRYLSQVINEYFHKNFFDFINQYRIQEAQKQLCDPKNGRKTVLEILYDSGFNSKSSFNTAFKKNVGMTPRQFRKNQKQ